MRVPWAPARLLNGIERLIRRARIAGNDQDSLHRSYQGR